MRLAAHLAIVLVAASVGCGAPTPPTGLGVPRPGTYGGTVRDVQGAGGAGVATLQLDATGASVVGTWLLDLSNGAYRRQGTLSGQTLGGHVSLVMRPANPIDCTFQVQGVTAPDDRLTGTWTATDCSVPYGGSIDLQRR
jgi:hypothetical protein